MLIIFFVRGENTPRSERPRPPNVPPRGQPNQPRVPTGRDRNTANKPSGADGQYNIETYIIVNPNAMRLQGGNIKDFVLKIMAETNQIYHYSSLTPNLNVVVRGFEEISETEIKLNTSEEAKCHLYLETFRLYKTELFKKKGAPEPDVTIYVTDRVLCDIYSRCSVLGCAYTGFICSERSAIILCRYDQDTATTLAHELGHLLGMDHNEDVTCAQYGGSPNDKKDLMSTFDQDFKVNDVHWTACNVAQMGKLFQAGKHKCLLDRPTVNMLDNYQLSRSRRSPLSHNGQCKLIYGRGWKYCKEISNCSAIFCSPTPNQDDCVTDGNGLADGTECGVNKVCLNGSCIGKVPRVTGICGVHPNNNTF